MIILDLETSGVHPDKNSILSLGAIEFENPDNRIYLECRLREGAEWSEEAERVHGIPRAKAKGNSLSEEQLVRQFVEWAMNVHDRTLAGQCIHFDFGFISECCRRYGIKWIFGYRIIDLHSVMYVMFKRLGHHLPSHEGISDISLDHIMVHLGIPRRQSTHNALHDALIETECFARIINGKPLLEEFKEYPFIERPEWVDEHLEHLRRRREQSKDN